jgi:hypothetical protein
MASIASLLTVAQAAGEDQPAMARRGLGVLVAVLLIALAIGAVAPGDARATQARGSRSLHCSTAPKPLVAALSSGLKPRARGRLGSVYTSRSQAQLSGPFAEGAYFMSAYVRGFGIATWAADTRAFRTGGGFITAVGVVAPRISYYGFGIPPRTLAAWGLTERTDGFATSRRCVQ